MDQTIVSRDNGKKPRFGCLLFGLLGLGGALALAVLAGAAYFLLVLPAREVSQSATEPVIVQPAPMTVEPAVGVPDSTGAPQLTAETQAIRPSVEPYQAGVGMQYPSLASLADAAGVVTLLPNQPTVLDIRWCARYEANLSSITSLLNLQITLDGIEVPISTFAAYSSQAMLQISSTKKEPGVCKNLGALVRDWSEGEHVVSYKLIATKAFHDGWKDHAADEVLQEGVYTVRVTPSASPVEWGRCSLFEDLQTELVFLSWRPNQPLTFYLKMPGGVPGLETEVSADAGPWDYSATLGNYATDGNCTFEGYAERLYCSLEVPSGLANSVQPVHLSVHGCSWPVYSNPDVEIPLPGN